MRHPCHLLQLAQEMPDTKVASIITKESFWEEYCRGRGWKRLEKNLHYMWRFETSDINDVTFEQNTHTDAQGRISVRLKMTVSPDFRSGDMIAGFEPTKGTISSEEKDKEYTWQDTALFWSLKSGYGSMVTKSGIEEDLKDRYSPIMTEESIKKLTKILYEYISSKSYEERNRRPFPVYESFQADEDGDEMTILEKLPNLYKNIHAVLAASKGFQPTTLTQEEVQGVRVMPSNTPITPPITPTTDVKASQQFLKKMYEQDIKLKNQSRSGWDNNRQNRKGRR